MNRVSALAPDMRPDLHYRDVMATDQSGAIRLGQLIKQARLARDWTQQDLHEESGVSVETIKRYENGKTKYPDAELVRRIVLTLNINPLEIPVALGFVSREEMGLPAEPARTISAATERLIDALEDPDVTDAEKFAILELLQARKRGRDMPPTRQSNRRAG